MTSARLRCRRSRVDRASPGQDAPGGEGVARGHGDEDGGEDVLDDDYPASWPWQGGDSAPEEGPGEAEPEAEHERERRAGGVAPGRHGRGHDERGDEDGSDAGSGEQRGADAGREGADELHAEGRRSVGRDRRFAPLETAAEAGEVEGDDVEHREGEQAEDDGDGGVEDGGGLDEAEGGLGVDGDQAEGPKQRAMPRPKGGRPGRRRGVRLARPAPAPRMARLTGIERQHAGGEV